MTKAYPFIVVTFLWTTPNIFTIVFPVFYHYIGELELRFTFFVSIYYAHSLIALFYWSQYKFRVSHLQCMCKQDCCTKRKPLITIESWEDNDMKCIWLQLGVSKQRNTGESLKLVWKYCQVRWTDIQDDNLIKYISSYRYLIIEVFLHARKNVDEQQLLLILVYCT